MLAKKDPLALQLYEQYNQVPMLHLRLGEIEIRALLDYLEEETDRLQPPQPIALETHPQEHGAHGEHHQHAE
ncbi:hypothetical protein D3C85_1862450 [compost metagenome]